MNMRYHGNPSWYELTTSNGDLEAAEKFYAGILGWTFQDSGMEGFDYHLARSAGDMVAGVMQMPADEAKMPPFWMTYFAVEDADAFVAQARASGASLQRGPDDVPGTGRFALLADPQGAAFGVLQPDMGSMSEADIAKAQRGEGAFEPMKPGRCNWNELMSTDPDAAFAFYSRLLGWTRGERIDMHEMGSYQLFQQQATDVGGMMGLGDAPAPHWLPYFGVRGALCHIIDAIKATGGSVHHGPIKVPGGSYVAVAQDPQGAWFAVIGAAK